MITGSHHIPVKMDDVLDTFYWADIDALVLPGGLPGATHLRDDEFLIKKQKSILKKGKIIAAICAAQLHCTVQDYSGARNILATLV